MKQTTPTPSLFIVMDDIHCESKGNFQTFSDARTAIVGFTLKPWDEPPNRAPCRNWENCGREYHIREYNDSQEVLHDVPICKVQASGVVWLDTWT